MSRRWGEIEAKPSMIWVQPPGTATMGHLFLDAYHATGDEYYYQAAEQVGGALIWGQHRSGGWNYFIDFAGPSSTQALVRDDRPQRLADGGIPALCRQRHVRRRRHVGERCSSCCASISRSAIRNTGPRSSARSISCSTASIRAAAGRSAGRYDPRLSRPISSYITFNDDVAAENIHFLIMVYQASRRHPRARRHPPRR